MRGKDDNSTLQPVTRIRHYADILNPLFWSDDFNRVDKMFEWACTLVRAAGAADLGWDSYTESLSLLTDLDNLRRIDLPLERFPHPDSTYVRLALISYSHLLEMSFPYDLLANLLRLRIGRKYAVNPLAYLNTRRGNHVVPASPVKKIKAIKGMADEAGLADVGTALEGIYNATIRNAVFHSDYAIHDNSMRLLSGTFCSRKDGTNTPLIAFDELGEVTSEAFAFHSALLQLWRRQRTLFTDFRGKFLPYDEAYKGILEYLFEGDVLNGFRAYWPNGTISTCTRTINGQSTAQNIAFNDDDSINFFVGEIFSDRDAFSPCVERGKRPYYGVVPGTDKRPYWPEIRQAYEL